MNKEKGNKNTDISARIAGILDYVNETKNAFALKLGYERAQTVYDIINGKSAPSYDFFKKFQFSEYSEIIDIDWLLTGRGSMLKKEVVSQMGEQAPTSTLPAAEASVYYTMYKEERAKAESQAEQIGALKQTVRQLEERIEGLQAMDVRPASGNGDARGVGIAGAG